MIGYPRPFPGPEVAWVDVRTGRLTKETYQYLQSLDAAMRKSAAGSQPVLFANLPTGTKGDWAFVSNGRKAGQGSGAGTGVYAFHDGTNWIAVDTGATVAA